MSDDAAACQDADDDAAECLDADEVSLMIDRSDFHLIPALTEAAVISDPWSQDVDYRAADALEDIRCFNLASFTWCAASTEEFRVFLTRYAPASVMRQFMELTEEDFQNAMRAWDPESPWNRLFMEMLGLARTGAMRGYRVLAARAHGPADGAGEEPVGAADAEADPEEEAEAHPVQTP